MNFLTSIAEKAFRIAGATEATRSYAAGKNNRLVGDWNTDLQSANQEVKQSIRTLRSRARQLARDNDYFIGFLKKIEANVVGTDGIKCQVDAKNSDNSKKEALNRKIEDEFKKWSRKEFCDVTGQLSLRDIAALALKTLATDGEFLIRYVQDVSSTYGLKLQMLDIDWLDEDYNSKQLSNGNRVVMSIELDSFDKPVAYYFTDPKWSATSVPGLRLTPKASDRIRIDASQICHRFIKDRIGMCRGITWAHGAMLTMNQLDGFDQAELVGARVGASNMSFVSPPVDESGQTVASTTPINTEVTPGQILELPAGYTVHEFSPTKPQDSGFSKRMLRKIATSLGVNYNTLTSDLEGVNFSSIRAGTIEERQMWKILQNFLAEHLYQDVYAKWLMFNANLVPVTQLQAVMFPVWRGKGFDWVDPGKDTKADIDALNRGFKSMSEIIAERGGDFEELMEQHAVEKAFIEKLGLQFASPDMQAQLAADAAEKEEKDAEDTDDKAAKKQKKAT